MCYDTVCSVVVVVPSVKKKRKRVVALVPSVEKNRKTISRHNFLIESKSSSAKKKKKK
jgi:hypothetical protein